MDGVEFMPTNKNILFGYQFKSIAGAAPIIGPIIAIQWGWLPALIWILGGRLFHRLGPGLLQRDDGDAERRRFLRRASHKLISPRARVILLSFIYFYLLLIAGAFGNVVVSTADRPEGGPDGLALPDDRRHPRRADDLQVAQGHHPDDRRDGGHRPRRHLPGHHRPVRQGPRRVHRQQPARLGGRGLRLLLLRRGAPDLAFRAARSTTSPPTSSSWGSSSGSSGSSSSIPTSRCPPTPSFTHRDRPDLADHVRDHRLRGDLRLAQHRLQLGDGPAAGE